MPINASELRRLSPGQHVIFLMDFWSSPDSLSRWSNILLWMTGAFGALAAILGLGSGLFGSRAGNLSQAKVDRERRLTDERVTAANVRIEAARAIAADAQQKLAEAQARIAATELRAAEAQERTAELQVRAAELANSLENTTAAVAGRWVTREQTDLLKDELQGYHLTIAICSPDAPEAKFFAESLMIALSLAGQEVLDCGVPRGARASSSGPLGPMLYVPGKPIGERGQDPLYRALVRAGLYSGESLFADRPAYAGMHGLTIPERGAPSRDAIEGGSKPPTMPKLAPRN